MKSVVLLSIVLLFTVNSTLAQKKNAEYQYFIQKASTEINIDGIINEKDWQQAQVATDFYMVLPMDTSYSNVRTEVRMTYNDQFLYLSAVCFHALPGPYVVESLRRDFTFGKNDNFLLFMDPFDDQTNGFSFGANAAGAQWDGLMYDGGRVDLSWDNKWFSAVKNYDDRYIFEAAIPFKSIRYKKGIKEWGINFSRLDVKTTEKSSWAPVPRQFPTASLAYTGSLIWDASPPQVGANVSLIPYALSGLSKDFEQSGPSDFRWDLGLDAKVAVTSSLNLDLTVNPDFSQVEVDRQVTNLDRFELFFPERRQFFLENGDLFANFGYETIRPFFSRRIGLGVPILYGARLSGKLNKDWRIGAMNVMTDEVESLMLPSQNFSVLALQRQVFARSNIGAILINKQSINYDPGTDPDQPVYSQYNRNMGLEYNLASSNNVWTGKFMVLKSFSPEQDESGLVHAANLQYRSKKLEVNWRHEYIGNDYQAEVGYVPRFGYIRLNPRLSYLFFPTGTKILSHGPSFVSSNFFDLDLQPIDVENYMTYKFNFRSLSSFTVWIANNYVKLLNAFDPTRYEGDTLATGTEHNWNSWGMEFESKPQSMFTYSFSSRNGGYYADGQRLNLSGSMGYRFQPYVSINVNASFNRIELPDPWGTTTFWLIGPRADLTLTNKLFFTAFAQYNEQIDNMNLNTRFQWRFKPASDLFIVYTDNYLPAPFKVRNRALVLKMTYWWNI
ncbi:MAG: DUF5916 domain-containing protein [Candidatus Cyclobacteriaceae bacterium M3_2C_046]